MDLRNSSVAFAAIRMPNHHYARGTDTQQCRFNDNDNACTECKARELDIIHLRRENIARRAENVVLRKVILLGKNAKNRFVWCFSYRGTWDTRSRISYLS